MSFFKSAIFREILITLLMAVTVYVVLNFSLQNSVVVGHSMEPNLHDSERVLINKLAYRFGGTPKRGDIVVFEPPGQVSPGSDYVKRIIGLPGETIVIKGGVITVIAPDGTETVLDESAYISQTTANYTSSVIPEGHYFVMGDNRGNSSDSRGGWTVPLSSIVGRAWLVVWPPSKWGSAPNHKVGWQSGMQNITELCKISSGLR